MKSNNASGVLHTLAIVCLSVILFFPSSLCAQNLDDFRSAAAANGVDLIPFPDLRSVASTLAKDVDKKKEDVQTFNYDVFAKQKDNFLSEIKKKKDEIDGIRKEIDDFKKRFAEVSTSCMEDGIKTKEQAIADNNKKIDELNSKLKDAATAFDNLNIARAKLREQFDKVLNELPNAKSSSAKYIGESPSSEDKSKFENYLSVIADQIKSQIQNHKEQEDGARGTKDRYEQLIKKTEL